MDTSANEYLKGVIESILFISEKPVTIEQFAEVLQESVGGVADTRKLVEELKEEYETKQRGMVIIEIAGGYQMLSSQHYASFVRLFLKTKVKEKLSRPALETLAIVAYKQPVSRGDIEVIRGVNSDGVVLHLLNKGLIKIVGKKDVAGRPYLYGSSKLFLEYFGLKSLRDLPKLEDVSLLLARTEESAATATIEAQAIVREQPSTAATLALDEAEAKAAEESRQAQAIVESEAASQENEPVEASEQIEAAEPVNEHVETARRNLEKILRDESADSEIVVEPLAEDIPADTGEKPMRLKEAMDGMTSPEPSRLETIIKEETEAAEKNLKKEESSEG